MAGQERGQVGADRHRADAGTAAAVGDAERLVEVEVAHVGAEATGLRHADEGVEVGAVDVHLAAVVVDDVAQLGDAGLVHAVGRGVGHHHCGEAVAGRIGLGPEVVEVDVALGVARHDDDLHAGHHRRRGVGAMGRRGDEAHVRPSSPRLRW